MENKIASIELLCMAHAPALFTLTDNNRDYLREWLPWLDSVQALSDTEQFITFVTSQNQGLTYAIIYQDKLCGVIGFHKIDENQKIGSIGYWLAEEYTGNGIINEVLKQMLVLGFHELHLNKIEIRCAEGNLKSRAVPERLNFINEATLRASEWLYSKYVNHVVYSLLASEYQQRE